ncbi:MAG: SurA N-terminal domain-containing protein [Candidatus Omnitrophota bacterium]
MLKFFRQKYVSKVIFWGLVILVMPAFVLWGTGNLGGSGEKGPSYVGTIDGRKISFEKLYESMTAMRSILVLNYAGQEKILESFLSNKPFLAKVAWDRLIMLKEAKTHKIDISDREVIDYIRSHPLFIRNGTFDDKIYQHVLRYNIGLTPRTFEEIVRENLAIQKLNDIIAKDIKVTDEEVAQAYRREKEQFKISYILTEYKDLADAAAVEDARAKEYYDLNRNEFVIPLKEGEKEHFAAFDDVKSSIKSYLAEKDARQLAIKNTDEMREKVVGMMEGDKETFETAASKLNLKVTESKLFSRSDYLDGIGEAWTIADIASTLTGGGTPPADPAAPGGAKKQEEVSKTTEVRSGALIFRVAEYKGIDEEAFKKDKEVFAKKVMENAKTRIFDEWFKSPSLRANLKIDFKDIDRYYR